MASSTTHELLHALSTHYESEQNVYRTVFSIHPFFKALNEGYTELFASRIEERPPHSYLNHVKFCSPRGSFIRFERSDDASLL